MSETPVSRSGRVAGKVALITGGARGQGRAQAVLFAQEGADVILVDICESMATIPYQLATKAELEETAELVTQAGGQVVAHPADVRDGESLARAVSAGLERFGHIDILCANAGVLSYGNAWEFTDQQWDEVVDTVLTGVFKTVRAVVPTMLAQGEPASIVLNSSTAGLKGAPNIAHYAAAKHGVVGYARSLALELAPHHIRVNTVHPAGIDSAMVRNEATYRIFRPDLDDPGIDDATAAFQQINALPIGLMEPVDVARAVLFLASDDARYVTGVALPIDAGAGQK
jgi:SDR family mycofactocin-dependent oxidoreductase